MTARLPWSNWRSCFLQTLSSLQWTGWNEHKPEPLAPRERRPYKASVCASHEVRGYGMTNAVLASGNVTRSFCAGDCKLGAGVPPWQVRESIDKILGLPPYNLGPGDQGPLIIPLPPEQ